MQIEMTIKGLMVDPITNMPIVILKDKDGDRVLPIWVGIFEANAIALQIENIQTPRPMTHDLLRNVLQELHARTVFNVGARYRFRTGGPPVVLRLEATNVFDRYAWEVDRDRLYAPLEAVRDRLPFGGEPERSPEVARAWPGR